MNTTYIKTYNIPTYNYNEILRYSNVNTNSSEIETLIKSCIDELQDKIHCRICYREYPILLKNKTSYNCDKVNDYNLDLGFMTTTSSNLISNLKGCSSIIVFAATIGLDIDRLIAKYSNSSPSRALILQAIGAERIESLCNIFNNDISDEKHHLRLNTKPRFSPGYGDFSLEAQRNIFDALNCPKNIGLTLNNSLVMSPSKSVTAIIGIYES